MTRTGLAVTALLAVSAIAVVPAAAGASVAQSQALVELTGDHVARSSPSTTAHRVELVTSLRSLTGVHTVLPALGRATRHGHAWVRVRLPGRPNGRTAWILASHTKRRSTEWHLVVSLSTRKVTVYRDGHADRRFSAVVGAPATPTPRGEFFVEEAVALFASDPGAPFALATSARSQVLQEFDGGPGQIAIHGVGNLAGALGTAVSHGCIRLSTAAITWLSQRIGAGAPVTVAR
jgi:lipoprotein-anchoring transpeptidase ErfK/SrfK